MNKKELAAAQRKQEDMALNRGLIWVGIAILMELLLIVVKRGYLEYGFEASDIDLAIAMAGILKVVRLAAPVLAVLCLVWVFLQLKRQKAAWLPVSAAVILAVIGLCAHVSVTFKDAGVAMLFMLVPALAGLALVFYLYQREFFLAALAAGLSALGLWFVRAGVGFGKETLIALVGIVIVLAVLAGLKKNGGKMQVLGKCYETLPKDTDYRLPLLTCVIGLAVLLAAMALGGAIAYYLMFVMVAWLFVLLVYYTVKMT